MRYLLINSKIIWRAAVLAVLIMTCAYGQDNKLDNDRRLQAKAAELAQRILIVDTHVDTPHRMHKSWEDISQRTEGGHFDCVRAAKGGLDAVFMAIYVPPEYEDKGGAKDFADELIDQVEQWGQKWPGEFDYAASSAQVKKQCGNGKVTVLLGMENGSPIQGDLKNLRHFYDRGIRYITLAHSKCNHICDSSYDEQRIWHGLSPFGRELVAEMNKVGMIIDVSHLSDETFYQVLEVSEAPVVATHSSCRKFTPGWERNMTDDMIERIVDKGGIVQITFGSIFVSQKVNAEMAELKTGIAEHVKTNGLEGEDKDEYTHKAWSEFAFSKATIGDVVANIDHAVELVGIDNVGIGSDFDGVDNVPVGLEDVSMYPNLICAMLKKGYSEEDIEKLLGLNFLRVWAAIEEAADK